MNPDPGTRWAVDALTFDAGFRAASPREFGLALASRIRDSAANGARVVVAPELLWLALAQFGEMDCRRLAERLRDEVWPEVRANLPENCLVVAGTAPWVCEATGQLRNRALIWPEAHQDKLHLTPWESPLFAPGEALRLIEFHGLRVAVLICLDVEVPEVAAGLRGREIDLLLVPSATDSRCGYQRVNRCASARAVELGCAVVVTHLTGKGPVEMIDENLGAAACYLPAQTALQRGAGAGTLGNLPEPVASGAWAQRYEIDLGALRTARQSEEETNPARLRPGTVIVKAKS